MKQNYRQVEFDLNLMQAIVPYILVVNESLLVEWASKSVQKQINNVVGSSLSQLVEFANTDNVVSSQFITAQLGVPCELSLLNGITSFPLNGRWFPYRKGFVFLAFPDVKNGEEVPTFSLDDFSPDDSFIDLLMLYGEYTTSLTHADAAIKVLEEKNEEIEKITNRLENVNLDLEKENSVRKKAEEELQRNYQFQLLLTNILNISLRDISLEEMLEEFINELTSVPWVLCLEPKGAIFLAKDKPGVLTLKAQRGFNEQLQKMCKEVPFGQCLCGRAAEQREIIFADHVDERHDNRYEGMPPHGHYCVPIIGAGEAKVLGVLNLYLKEKTRFSEVEESFVLWSVANVLAGIIRGKLAEEELKKEHLRSARLLAALSSILIGIDENNRIIQWNMAAEKTFDIAAADVLGKPFAECGVNWDWEEIFTQINLSMNQVQPVRIEEFRFKDHEGKDSFLGLTINSIKSDQGKHSECLLLGRDITEHKVLLAQLIQAQKLESIGQLAAGIAHEINTPMQYVSDNTRFLQDSFNDFNVLLFKYNDLLKIMAENNEAKELIGEIKSAVEDLDQEYLVEEIPKAINQSLEGIQRVSRIVRAMKEFSHPGQEEKTPIDINRAIENTLTVARNEWKYVAEMVTDFAPELPLVPCLVGEFNQVILNILVNAAHAITESLGKNPEKKGTITISTRQNEDWLEIRITDTGTGIPEEICPRIFDPFFTTKEVGKGTGQGLALSHSVVVDKHQGTLTLETEVGKGTTFIIRLPLNNKLA